MVRRPMSDARPQSWPDGASKMFIPAALSQGRPGVTRLSVTKSQRLALVERSACVSSFKSGNWLERRQQAKCMPSKMAGGNRLHKIVFYTSTITLTIAGEGGRFYYCGFYFVLFCFSHGARARTQDLKHTRQMLTTEQHSRPFMPSLN